MRVWGGKSECRPVMDGYGLQHHPARKRADFPAVSRHENNGGIDTEGVANVGGFVALVLPSPIPANAQAVHGCLMELRGESTSVSIV